MTAESTTNPNQIWVSDITYIRTREDFEYLTLIMDLHSHKIVGHHCGESLDADASLKALDQALDELEEELQEVTPLEKTVMLLFPETRSCSSPMA